MNLLLSKLFSRFLIFCNIQIFRISLATAAGSAYETAHIHRTSNNDIDSSINYNQSTVSTAKR